MLCRYTTQWQFLFWMDALVSTIALTLCVCLQGIHLYKTGLNQMDAYTAMKVQYTYSNSYVCSMCFRLNGEDEC